MKDGKGKLWERKLTDLDIATTVEENIIRLDITMNDALAVEMRKTFACLERVSAKPSK